MSLSSVRNIYNGYAWIYDFAFGRIFHQGRHLTTQIINKNAEPNANILELGVGTGLSLPLYRSDLNISGIDISEKMLNKAQRRIERNNLTQNITLKVMDAAQLEFPDQSFDFVVAMYVASVVPDISAFLQEISRVCKPTSQILFVNHFASESPGMRFIEKKLARVQDIVGFKSDFSINHILDYKKFELLNTYNTNLFGYWKLLHCKNL